MIKFNYNTIIVFDINDALKSDGDSGIYLMYAYVRAIGILKTNNYIENIDISTPSEIIQPAIDLLTLISFIPDVLKITIKSREVSKLTEYTYNLAKQFSAFYTTMNISKLENVDEKQFYLNINLKLC